jgi:hypothetical protein
VEISVQYGLVLLQKLVAIEAVGVNKKLQGMQRSEHVLQG